MSWYSPFLYPEALYAGAVNVASRYDLPLSGIRCLWWEGGSEVAQYCEAGHWRWISHSGSFNSFYTPEDERIDFPTIPRAYDHPFAWMVFSSSDECLEKLGLRRKSYPLCHFDPGYSDGVFDVIAGARTKREKARVR